MSKGPSRSQALALKAAALANLEPEEDVSPPVGEVEQRIPDPEPPSEKAGPARSGVNRGGRPKGRRAVAARQTIYLDEKRHAALARIAEDRGRSVHSLILEGIDQVIGKPMKAGWE